MKPRAIGYILLSYFQQNSLVILGTVIAIIILLVASLLAVLIAKSNMAFLLRNSRDKKRSLFHISRLLQPGLFSPAYVSITQQLVGIPVLILYLGMLIIPVFFPVVSVIRLLPLIIMGFLVFIILLSLSLLFSDLVFSPECKGWMLSNITLGLLVVATAINKIKLFFNNTPGTWIFIIVLAVFTGLLLRQAYKKWSNTELNFIGPQV